MTEASNDVSIVNSLIEESEKNVQLEREMIKSRTVEKDTKTSVTDTGSRVLTASIEKLINEKKLHPVLDSLCVAGFKHQDIPVDKDILSLFAEKGCPKIVEVTRSIRSAVVFVRFETKEDARAALDLCDKVEYKGLTLKINYKYISTSKDVKKKSLTSSNVRASVEKRQSVGSANKSRGSNRSPGGNFVAGGRYQQTRITSPWMRGAVVTPLMGTSSIPPLLTEFGGSSMAPFPPQMHGGMGRPLQTSSTDRLKPLMDFDEFLPPSGVQPPRSLGTFDSLFGRSIPSNFDVPPPTFLSGSSLLDSGSGPVPLLDRWAYDAGDNFLASVPPPHSYNVDSNRPSSRQTSATRHADDDGGFGNSDVISNRRRQRSRSRSPSETQPLMKELIGSADRERRAESRSAESRKKPKMDDEFKGRQLSRSTASYCLTIGERLERMNARQQSFARMKIEEALFEAEFGSLGGSTGYRRASPSMMQQSNGADGGGNAGRHADVDHNDHAEPMPISATDWIEMITSRQ